MSAEVKDFKFEGGVKSTSLIFAIIGLVSILVSFVIDPHVGWVDYLVSTLFVTTMAAAAIFFLCINGVLRASWLTPYKRIPEAMTKFLPIGFVLMLGMYFGLHTVYEWTHTDLVMNDPILREKVAWLNTPGFMMRMVIYFAVFIIVAWKLRSLSNSQTKENALAVSDKLVSTSAIGLVFFSLAICFASFDWIMSVEPHWFSTIFGVYTFAGSFVAGIAFITLSIIKLKEKGYLEGYVNENHLHDLGKWMFGMSTFWAYIWLSQYLLIWYANIPEETEYYVLRHDHWNGMFFLNLVINWVAPFFLLMAREWKRNTKRLKLVAWILLVGHFMDLYLMVAPKVFHHHNSHVSGMGVLQLLQMLGFLGLFVYVVGSALTKAKLVPVNDPTLDEGAHLHQ